MSRPPPLKPVPSFKSPNVRLALSDADGLTPRTPHSSRKASHGANKVGQTQLDTPDFDEIDLLPSPDRQRLLPVPGTGTLERGDRYRSPGKSPLRSPWTHSAGLSFTNIIIGISLVIVVGLTSISIFAPELLENDVKFKVATPSPSLPALALSPTTTLEYLTQTQTNFEDFDSHPTSVPSVPIPPTGVESGSEDTSSRIIDYSNYTTFPLTPLQYAEECWKQFSKSGHAHGSYWQAGHHGVPDVAEHASDLDKKYCSSSITYMLDGTNSGLVAELAVIAQVAGLAREVCYGFFKKDHSLKLLMAEKTSVLHR